MTTISDPSAMTPDDPRWLSWFMQQRRFDRLSRKAQTGASLITDFASGIYEMGYPGQRRGSYELSDIVKVSRSTGGGRFNSAGVYEWVGNDVPRLDYDPVTLQPLGILIEEQRTNLLTYSAGLVGGGWIIGVSGIATLTATANAAIGIDGAMSATRLDFSAKNSGDNQILRQQVTGLTNPTTLSPSVYIRADAPTSIQLRNGNGASGYITLPVGTSWTRLASTPGSNASATFNFDITRLVSTALAAETIYVCCAQLEAGAFPTSYIPTVASQVTRAADIASVNTLSPWYNASEGTLFVEYVTEHSAADKYLFSISDGTPNQEMSARQFGGQTTRSAIINGGVVQAVGNGKSTTIGAIVKGSLAYKENDSAWVTNGVIGWTDTSCTVPAANKLVIGARLDLVAGFYLNGHIRSIKYYPRRLSNSELQAITV